jgi:hypothetical protein
VKAIQSLSSWDAMKRPRTLWTEMLDAKTYADDEQTISQIANLQFLPPDQLMADIPGIEEPLDRIRLAQTYGKPRWSVSNGPSSCWSMRAP